MYDLPITVEVAGKSYNIRNRADYRTILGVISLCEDPDLTEEERIISALIVFYDGFTDIDDIFAVFGDTLEECVKAMYHFISCAYDEEIGRKMNTKLIDWVQDEKLIVSAINGVAKTEIRALDYLHWWSFLSYYMAVGDSALSMVVGIRSKLSKGKKLEKYEQEFKRENPAYFRWKNKEIEADNLLNSIWNKKKGGEN